ncbi:hypothetical protein [Bifidobacterium saguinibicoloris]|uniref:hypothetical protein n=1 Tax=Bifidobacterium saguinibicoloris TaxID=2834433 RepID=UPI001C55B2EC|nr:hypothetical protein [Bifidobacterium saguinibicoloris]MBW3079882.1 hypothetical protein [Bifidobacterium saguinibicoloris]
MVFSTRIISPASPHRFRLVYETMNTKILALILGATSLVLGVAGHAIPAGVFGLAGVIFALPGGNHNDD